ncbi:hypothetical protein BC332_32629 [Capsicum chinense]|nr:hypothetical protein BC332_32629 [Capsicum chinense]
MLIPVVWDQRVRDGWLIYGKKDCQVFLFNPLSSQKIILPSIETLPTVKGVNRNSQSGLVESYMSVFGPHLRPISPKVFSERVISDVVRSSSPMDDDCIAVVTYGRDSEVAFCRIRDDPNCWTLLDSPFTTCGQIVYHSRKKLFYALSDCSSKIEAWDLHNDPIKSIGNLAIFLNGGYGGFTLSTTEFPELRPSSIYFADNRPCCYDTDSDWRYQDLVIYDYKEDSIMDKITSISLLRSWLIPDA